jgi:hypothetical protein
VVKNVSLKVVEFSGYAFSKQNKKMRKFLNGSAKRGSHRLRAVMAKFRKWRFLALAKNP